MAAKKKKKIATKKTKKVANKPAKKKAKKVAKKPAKKKAAKKTTKKVAKKKTTKKVAKKKTTKKVAKKTTTKKVAKKPAKKTTTKKAKPSSLLSSPPPVSAEGYVLPLPKRSLELSALAAAYKDGDATAHPVTSEQMAEVSLDGLRGDDGIDGVADDAEVAPFRFVDHGEGRYSLCLDDFRMPRIALFDERGLQGGGYTWEAVADSLVRLRRPELVEGLEYDSEAGMFVAIGTKPTLLALARLVQEALDDEELLSAAVDAADPDRLE